MPKGIPEDGENLIKSLLSLKPEDRIGALNIHDLIKHPFFKGIDFDKITEQLPPQQFELTTV